MRKLIIIQILLFITLSVFSQNDSISNSYAAIDTLQKDFGLFTNDEIFELSLRFDINEYKRTKNEDKYLDAILTYHINSKDSINKRDKTQVTRNMPAERSASFHP